MTAAAGKALGKPVGVCGEAASDPLLALVLVGLGVTSLSMAPVSSRRFAPPSPATPSPSAGGSPPSPSTPKTAATPATPSGPPP